MTYDSGLFLHSKQRSCVRVEIADFCRQFAKVWMTLSHRKLQTKKGGVLAKLQFAMYRRSLNATL